MLWLFSRRWQADQLANVTTEYTDGKTLHAKSAEVMPETADDVRKN